MKKYKYIRLDKIENYEGWELVQILQARNDSYYDMCVICKEVESEVEGE